ncbi:carbonic anhydrase 15-like isoform X3 [Lynx canadensis]|uniref:carbonic anhydrase 15-like isoform X3 n=1 Tax=Lynx canadensis TaxID=61383 RepID=UPI0013C51810|nr:carbonic anhydrase 15-like isoform X3 [Lynx canadensis]
MELRESPDCCPSSQFPVHCPQAPGATTPRTQSVVRTECHVRLYGISLCPVATRQSDASMNQKQCACQASLVSAGPTHWKEMAPACGGPAQSPINIDLHLVQRDPTLGPFILQGYNTAPPGPWTLENDGHTVLLHIDAGPQSHLEIRGAGLPLPAYRALQLHFHWGGPGRAGSEHSLDGQRRPMEEQDTDNANFSVLVSSLKNVSERGVSVNLASTFPLSSLLPGASGLSRYYRYSGSLTTPGCQPAVVWTVFEDAVPIGRSQVGPPPFPLGSSALFPPSRSPGPRLNLSLLRALRWPSSRPCSRLGSPALTLHHSPRTSARSSLSGVAGSRPLQVPPSTQQPRRPPQP